MFEAALGRSLSDPRVGEVVRDGDVVGVVSAYAIDPVDAGRWITVPVGGGTDAAVAPVGRLAVRFAASGSNQVASWVTGPVGYVAVFGDGATLLEFLTRWPVT